MIIVGSLMKISASRILFCVGFVLVGLSVATVKGAESPDGLLAKPGLHQSLTEPPCSYCSTQHRKKLIQDEERVVAWVRGPHNGGAIPLRHFLAAPRIINDTYGLFCYDADGGYVTAFTKDYGYEFYGWRRGVMVMKGRDGTLWSALSGKAFQGPQAGKQLTRLPSLLTQWGFWLMLHPESTAYNLYDGKKYPMGELPRELSAEARENMGRVDERLAPLAPVMGVEVGGQSEVFPLDRAGERECYSDTVGGRPVVVFWSQPTQSAVAFSPHVENRRLTFFADREPETAPFKDKETGSRWTLAGRAVDGPLKGKELDWINSVQCRWYAWAAEYPSAKVFGAGK